MKTTKAEMDVLRGHEANAKVYENTLNEIMRTIRALEPLLRGNDPVKAAWAKGWVSCAVEMAEAIKQKKGPVRSLSDEVFPF